MRLTFTTLDNIKSSPMEDMVANSLNERNIKYYREVSFEKCRNSITGAPLRFDFYVESMNMLIEYDGKNFHQDLDTKLRDGMKDDFAKLHSIKLVRISGGAIKLFVSKYLAHIPIADNPNTRRNKLNKQAKDKKKLFLEKKRKIHEKSIVGRLENKGSKSQSEIKEILRRRNHK